MLTKEPEMLQPDAFCKHTMQQNATAAGAPSGPPWGSCAPQTTSGFKGAASRRGEEREGREGEERGEEGKGRKGAGRDGKGMGGDTQLEQGRRLAKAGPDTPTADVTRDNPHIFRFRPSVGRCTTGFASEICHAS